MEQLPTMVVALLWHDRDGRKAQTNIRLPFSTPIDSAISFGIAIASAFGGASDATVTGFKLEYKLTDHEPPDAGIDSNIYRKLVLFYRNEDGYETLSLPSPKAECFQTVGTYAGIKADAEVVALEPWVSPPPNVVSNLATPEGEAFPVLYVVGGLAE